MRNRIITAAREQVRLAIALLVAEGVTLIILTRIGAVRTDLADSNRSQLRMLINKLPAHRMLHK